MNPFLIAGQFAEEKKTWLNTSGHRDLTPCDYFCWGYAKESVYVPPLPMTMDDLWKRMFAMHQTVDTLNIYNKKKWAHHLE